MNRFRNLFKKAEKTVPAVEATAMYPQTLDQEELQDVINATYPGLQLYVRDTDLPEAIAAQYQPGSIIYERAYVDASSRVQGMVTTHRYVILSNHMANFAVAGINIRRGLNIAPKDSHFKVLGTHTYHGKKAIFLLHLPNDERWKFFRGRSLSVDHKLLKMAIDRFEASVVMPPIRELTTSEWMERCSFPMGMSSDSDDWTI